MIKTITVPQVGYDTRMYCDLVYTNAFTKSAAALPLRFHLICPRGKEGDKFPLLIYVGGGGWRVSAPERHLPELAHFASQGFVVASIEYRTTAHSRFPAQIEDVKTAVRYLRKNREQFQIDPDRVFMMGGSAGGYLTAMTALTGGSENFRGTENLDISDKIQGAVCLYGLYDLRPYAEAMQEHNAAALPISLFLPNADEETVKKASPVTYIHEKTPPILLLHGTNDRMVDRGQSILFHDALQAHKHDVQLYLLDGADHADTVFSQPKVQNLVLDFLSNIK